MQKHGEGPIFKNTKTFGSAAGDGNCLISSLLQGLLKVQLLPQDLRIRAEVRRCRAALVALPAEHPLRPVQRDLRTNRIMADATTAEHNQAYLQFDLHAAWIVKHCLQWHRRRVPQGGLRCKCYSRFDDVLGAAESVTLVSDVLAVSEDAENPVEMAVYNWTGEDFHGVHYDPVYIENV